MRHFSNVKLILKNRNLRHVTLCQSPGINNVHTVCSSHDKSSELQFDMCVFFFFLTLQ